jgi:Spy/CpxP family protein refolding chaperone
VVVIALGVVLSGVVLGQMKEIKIIKAEPGSEDMEETEMQIEVLTTEEGGLLSMLGGCGKMGHEMMMGHCMGRGMTRNLKGVDYYLCCEEMVGLTDEQVESLKSLKDLNQRALIKMKADLELAMLDLDKVLDANEIDLSQAKKLTQKIADLRAKMQYSKIEASVKARQVLTEEQLGKRENPAHECGKKVPCHGEKKMPCHGMMKDE